MLINVKESLKLKTTDGTLRDIKYITLPYNLFIYYYIYLCFNMLTSKERLQQKERVL